MTAEAMADRWARLLHRVVLGGGGGKKK